MLKLPVKNFMFSAEGEMAQNDVRSAFSRNEDGSWVCITPVTIDHPHGRMQVSLGTTVKPGVPFMGIDLAAWLEQQNTLPKF